MGWSQTRCMGDTLPYETSFVRLTMVLITINDGSTHQVTLESGATLNVIGPVFNLSVYSTGSITHGSAYTHAGIGWVQTDTTNSYDFATLFFVLLCAVLCINRVTLGS